MRVDAQDLLNELNFVKDVRGVERFKISSKIYSRI